MTTRIVPILALLTGISLAGFAPQEATHISTPLADTVRPGYVGDATCRNCHSEKAMSYAGTAHAATSHDMKAGATRGSFQDGFNLLKIADPAPAIDDPGVSYKMEASESGYFMTALTGFTGKIETHTERMDLVIGAGVRGQSFLSWRGDALFEMPVSYWTEGSQWINSPGYRNGLPNFNRPASPRCLECHTSFIEGPSNDPTSNHYKRTSLITGISCEVCHGPGARHATLFARTPDKTTIADPLILNPKYFPRDRQVDMCALCHNGAAQQELAPAFSYVPGTDLKKYLDYETAGTNTHPDVHANQVGLLKMSRCYLSSPQMTCSTCHEVHAPERTPASYSAKCLTCHQLKSCGIEKKLGPSIVNNCIDCHMPVEQTSAIVSQTGNKVIRTSMRTHWIKPYPDLGEQ